MPDRDDAHRRFLFKSKSPTSANKTDDVGCKLEKLMGNNTRPGVVSCNNCSDNLPRFPLVKIADGARFEKEVLRKLKGNQPEGGGEIDVHGCKLTMADMTSLEAKNASVNCNNCSEIKGTPLVKTNLERRH